MGKDSLVMMPEPRAVLGAAAMMDWIERDTSIRMAIDAELRIVWSNAMARSALRRRAPLFIREGCLCFDDAAGTDAWKDFFLSLDDKATRSIVHCADGFSFAILRAFARRVDGKRLVLVTVSVVGSPLDIEACGLPSHFKLTPAESQVAQKLVDLVPPSVIAQQLEISVHTVRSHIRKVYGKMAVNSQTQLLRLAHRYCQI